MDELVLLEIDSKPRLPKNWNYRKSVKKMKRLVLNWRNISVEILNELYIARIKLSAQGVRNDLDSNGSKLGWENYLREIGLSKETVRRWLGRYNPNSKVILPREIEGDGKVETKFKCPCCGYKW